MGIQGIGAVSASPQAAARPAGGASTAQSATPRAATPAASVEISSAARAAVRDHDGDND